MRSKIVRPKFSSRRPSTKISAWSRLSLLTFAFAFAFATIVLSSIGFPSSFSMLNNRAASEFYMPRNQAVKSDSDAGGKAQKSKRPHYQHHSDLVVRPRLAL